MLPVIKAPVDLGTEIADSFVKQMAKDDDYDLLIEKSCQIVCAASGSQIATQVKGAVNFEMIKTVWPILRNLNLKTQNRVVSSGLQRIRTCNKTFGSSEITNSGVLGYYDRYPRTPFCRKCSWNQNHDADWKTLIPLFQKVNNVHREHAQKEWNLQAEFVGKAKKDWIIPETVYSTVTLNKNYRTAYHFDGKNLAGGFSAMLLLREGHLSGGFLVLPRYRLAIKMDTGDIVLFNGQKELHGNTAISLLTQGAQRCTLVHYFRKNIVNCLGVQEEAKRAKRYSGGSLR